MFSYLVGAAIVTHAIPSAWTWGLWGVTTAWNATYWLCYGRYAAAREEARMHDAIVRAVKAEIAEEYELMVGGTDLILVKKIN